MFDRAGVSFFSDSSDKYNVLHKEIEIARNIQSMLLNARLPEFDGGEVTGISIPARLIGGDYFDFYPLPNGKLRIVIGDVMGKGIPAAMLMILTRGAFRSASESIKGPGETLRSMNNAIENDLRALRSFVTLFCADWDPKSRTLSYANAGHNLPLLIRKKETVTLPKVPGIMLGGLPNQEYKECQIKLNDDEYVFFYTDGIIDAQDMDGNQFKLRRLLQVLQKHDYRNVKELENKVFESIYQFTKGAPQRDDMTMVIFKVTNEKNSDLTDSP